MRNRKAVVFGALICLAAGCLRSPDLKDVWAAGNTRTRGQAAVGDLIPADTELINLSTKDQAVIRLKPIYEPKSYTMRFDCMGGSFADGKTVMEQKVSFNDGSRLLKEDLSEAAQDAYIRLPEQPVRKGWVFQGWFLKGNGVSSPSGITAEDELLHEKSRYMIDNDTAKDLALTKHDAAGKTIAAAIWRNQLPPEPDAFSPLEPAGDLYEDPWKKGSFHTRLISFQKGLADAEAYSSMYGPTAYRYGNLVLNAETSGAADYLWYRKKAGAAEYEKLENEGPVLREAEVTGELDGCTYRCMADLGGEYMPVYETEIRVYALPEIGGIDVYENGELKSPLSFYGKETKDA